MYEFVIIVVLIIYSSLIPPCSLKEVVNIQTDAKILILGAGMSGISAAKTLHKAGYKNFQILEASGRVGGRIREAHIGPYPVELGAMWIYGKGTNPIYKMAADFNMSVVDSLVDDWTVRNENGENVTLDADKAYSKLTNIIHNFSKYAKVAKKHNFEDFDVMSGIRHFNWHPETVIDDAIETYALDFETGMHPSALSSFNLVLEETFEDFGSYEMLAMTDKRGFSSMVRNMCGTFLAKDDQRLLFNKTVSSIHYSNTNVSVETSNGDVYYADYVLVTFSLGVLQKRSVTFIPSLPDKKVMSIDKFGMAAYTHIYVQYPVAFWDETMYILYASRLRGRLSCWQNLNVIYPECNILQLSLFSEDSRWAERSTDHEIIQEIQRTLQSMYPNISIPKPSDYKISRWNSDPLIVGAFSYWPASFTAADMDVLRAPVGRVHFAGEHLHPIHYGFAHGAYITGESSAYDVIRRSTNQCEENYYVHKTGSCVSSKASLVMAGPSHITQKFSVFFLCCSVFCFLLI